jgi:hypothetical protein
MCRGIVEHVGEDLPFARGNVVLLPPSFLGGYLVYQASILRATYFMQGLAGFVIDFIQLLHGACVPVQEVKPGINHGILSLPEGQHSEEASQTGHHHLGHAWNLRQTWAKQCASCRSQMHHAMPKCSR